MYFIAMHCRPPSSLTQGYKRFAMVIVKISTFAIVIDKISTSTHSRLRGASTCFLISFTTITFFNASGFVEATSCSKQKVMVALHLQKCGCFFVELTSLNTFQGKISIMLIIDYQLRQGAPWRPKSDRLVWLWSRADLVLSHYESSEKSTIFSGFQ